MKKKSLVRSVFTVSILTFVSRILGLARDVVFANYFGASAMMDAFNVAFRIPNLFRRFFGEGAFNQSFVPVFSQYYAQKNDELKLFIAQISGTLGAVLLLISALGVIFAPLLVTLFASGFAAGSDQFNLTADLVRWMIPYVFFICMTAMFSSVLNALNNFAIPALVPSLLNICFIAAAIVSTNYLANPIMGLAYAVLLAGFLQCITVLYFIHRKKLISRPKIAFGAPGVKQVMLLMVPAIIGSSSSQINILINTQLASRLQTGSITWLYYSDRLVEFALGTIAVALGTVVLPKLSHLRAQEDQQGFASTIDWSVRIALVLGIPSSIGLIFLAKPLLALLFMRGEFAVFDVDMASRSLVTYALSVAAYFLIRVLAPVYYARQNTKTPVKFGLIAIGVNIVMQFILVKHFQHAGLALSTSIASWVNALLLIGGLIVMNIHNFKGILNRKLLALIPANIVLALFLLWIGSFASFWLEAALLYRLGGMVGVLIVSLVGYFAILHLLGISLRSLKEVDYKS